MASDLQKSESISETLPLWGHAFLADQRRPFLKAAVAYGLIGLSITLGFTPDPRVGSFWFSLLFFLSVGNLFFLGKVVAVLIDLMSHQGTQKGLYSFSHALRYGTMKFALLGAILITVWKSETAPMLARMLGLGTLVAIPLLGGIGMSQKQNPRF